MTGRHSVVVVVVMVVVVVVAVVVDVVPSFSAPFRSMKSTGASPLHPSLVRRYSPVSNCEHRTIAVPFAVASALNAEATSRHGFDAENETPTVGLGSTYL